MLSLLQSLLQIYSPSGQEAAAVSFLVGQMQALGFRAFADPAGNAVGVLGDGPQTIVLLGHIDTVPGEIRVRVENGELWGRGAVDAKGPLATFVCAAARVKDQIPAGWRVVVIGAVGEETNSPGAQYAKDHYRPAFTVIGEPSSWEKVALGYKGSLWYAYRVQRSVAHTAGRAESACDAAIGFWNRTLAWASEYNQASQRLFEQVSPTLRGMSSETDGFSESAGLRFNLRIPPGMEISTCDGLLRSLLDDATLTLLDSVPAYRSDKNTPLVRAFLSAIRAQGGKPNFSVKNGTADMNIVGPVWNCPIVAYGPGDSSLDHTPEERIAIAEYESAIDVLTQVLGELVKG
ncbi:MAG: [LysW]-lysine hydrolase [Chloroflexota bacterium]